MGTAEFTDNSIAVKQIGPVSCGDGCTRIGRGLSYITKKGGAVHNKVSKKHTAFWYIQGNNVSVIPSHKIGGMLLYIHRRGLHTMMV